MEVVHIQLLLPFFKIMEVLSMNVNLDLLLYKEIVVVSDSFTKNKLSESNKIKGTYL